MNGEGGGSALPGLPPEFVLARQFSATAWSGFAAGFTRTSAGPPPSGAAGHGVISS